MSIDQPLVGYHTSSAGGYFNSVKHAKDYGLETFQFFLGSPRTWSYRDLKKNEVKKFKEKTAENNFDIRTIHMNYLPNPSTPLNQTERRSKIISSLKEEIRRADLLNVQNLVFHIGSHKGKGFESAIEGVRDFIQTGLDQDPNVRLLLETSAGSTNSVGSTFEEIAQLIEPFTDNEKVGVCIDTCHIFAAGYDIRDEDGVNAVLEQFDSIIGREQLHVMHINDSKGELGEGKDRHANIGHGNIGKEGFRALFDHEMMENLPFILETPGKYLEDDIGFLHSLKK